MMQPTESKAACSEVTCVRKGSPKLGQKPLGMTSSGLAELTRTPFTSVKMPVHLTQTQ